MAHFRVALPFLLLASTAIGVSGQEKDAVPIGPVHFISLIPKANLKLQNNLGRGLDGDNLADLPNGEQTFASKAFKVEDGLIHLSGSQTKDKPAKVEGIKVDRKFATLNILHGTNFGAQGEEGDPLYTGDGTMIGTFKVYYEDKTTINIPIVYGKDVHDLWEQDKRKFATRGILAWVGTNAMSRRSGETIRLYVTSWENPYPPKTVTHIDYQSTNSACAPFCVAMTAEGDASPRPDFYHDFRKKHRPDATFKVIGPDAPGRMMYEEEGLRISLPGIRESSAPLALVTRSRIRGDFEITASYELLHAEEPKSTRGVGFDIYLMTDTPTREATSIARELRARGRHVYSGVRMTTDPQGKRKMVGGAPFLTFPAAGKSGQLRLTRRGPTLMYSVAEGAGKEFRDLYQTELGLEDVVFLRLGALSADGPYAVDVRVLDLRIRPIYPK